MNVHRFENWPSILHSYLESRRATPFEYGAHDCCLFAADAIFAITGIDPAASFRNHYYSAFTATRRMREVCVSGSLNQIAVITFSRCGFPVIHPYFAGRGDIMLIRQAPRADALAVVALDGWPVIAADTGWRASDRQRAVTAWKI